MQLDNSCNLLYELGMKYGTDKVHHHEYHKIYDFYLKNFYNSRGSILEIGIDNGTSVKLWLDLFPHAHIYGMDIKVTTFGDRYSIIKGDQSNCSHLSELVNVIKDTGLFFINDDGSHIPEHQLLSFNTLFPLLCEGGIYIIEDIETSYWTKTSSYGYSTNYGYKHPNSIIEIFKEVADAVNYEFAGNRPMQVLHHNLIGSITFSKNCIIIVKHTQTDKQYRYSHKL